MIGSGIESIGDSIMDYYDNKKWGDRQKNRQKFSLEKEKRRAVRAEDKYKRGRADKAADIKEKREYDESRKVPDQWEIYYPTVKGKIKAGEMTMEDAFKAFKKSTSSPPAKRNIDPLSDEGIEKRTRYYERTAGKGGKGEKVLSTTDAERLGVPYGTTEKGAKGITPMSTTSRDKVSAFNDALGMVDMIGEMSDKVITAKTGSNDIETAWNALKQKVDLTLGAWLKYNPDAAEYESFRKGFLAKLARASGEKGALSKEDVERVEPMMPTFGDTEELKNRKNKRLANYLIELQQKKLQSLTSQVGGATTATTTIPSQTKDPNSMSKGQVLKEYQRLKREGKI